MTDDLVSTPPNRGDPLPVEPLDPVIVADILETLTIRQEALEHAFDALARRLGATKDGPWTWATLGPTRTRELFTELRDWVDWLTVRYTLNGEHHTIAPCWYAHPVAVEELTALMVAWRAAYSQDEAAPSDALINWHDRWLWPTLHRLNTQLRVWTKCTGGTHTDPPPTATPTTSHDFNSHLDQLTGVGPPETMSTAQVHNLLVHGDAVALLPDDPKSPVRASGTWYAISADSPGPTTWRRIQGSGPDRLDELLAQAFEPPAQESGEAL